MDRTKVRELMEAAEKAFADLAKAHGLASGKIRASFTNESVKITAELAEIGEGGMALDREAVELQKYAKMYGLPADAYSKTFVDGGHQYKLVGLAARRSRFPLIAEREDGKRYKFPIDRVKALLGAA